MKSKEILRKRYKNFRNSLSRDFLLKASFSICQGIYKYLKPFKFKTIMIYYPLKGEINVKPLFYYFKRKKVLFPKVLGINMKSYKVKSLKHLRQGKFNVFEPQKNFVKMLTPNVVIVPGLVFDKDGYRLGFGKGYYDRFLRNYMYKIGVALKETFVKSLPKDRYDKNVDLIFVKEEKNVNKKYIKKFSFFRCWRRYWSCRNFK